MIARSFHLLLAFVLAVTLRAENISSLRVGALTCEHLANPIGIGARRPRLSWKLYSDRTGTVQSAYEIRSANRAADLATDQPGLWDSGKVSSDRSVLVGWDGPPLRSRSQAFWQVRVWDQDGQPSAWSEVASFELGLLEFASEWGGHWITSDLPRYDVVGADLATASWVNAGSTASQAAAVRTVLNLPADAVVRRATVTIAADGLITLYVNGHAFGQGSSSRTAPLIAEIGTALSSGRNVIAIGSAAVRGAIRRDSGTAGRNAVAAHGLVELDHGAVLAFATDGSWKAAVAPAGGWFDAGFDDSAWAAATDLGAYAAHPSNYADNTTGPGRYLRKNFLVRGPIVKARLYSTALGVYEASLNGRRVSDTRLDPGWTDYTKRVMVQTTDVTRLLTAGKNTLGAVLGDGWYAGRLGWMGRAQYGTRPVFAAQLEITYADGTTDTVATDESWQTGTGEIVGADLQWGEVLDARKTVPNWDCPDSASDPGWTPAIVEPHAIALVPQLGPPIRPLLELAPKTIRRCGDAWIVDLGQNLVGHVRLSARGPAGTVIRLRHAEMLNPDGTLYTANLRPALAMDTFILRGAKEAETFEPHFTFHGFRYVEVTGYPGTLTAADLRAIVVGSDTPRTGTFESSDPALNRLYENIVWSQRGNFLSVPTDCPQRDERMGWMGDAQVFAPTAAGNADVAAFFTKWLVDVRDGQGADGDYSDVSPRIDRPQPAWPVWGDAGVIIPWTMYDAYGDEDFLAANYSAMVRWVEFSLHSSTGFIRTGGVGDHLAPRRTPVEVVDTAYFANSARLVARAAAILGKTEDAARYERLTQEIVAAFNQAFVSPDGKIKGDTQTAYLLAIHFDLLPEPLRAVAARRLAADVEQSGHLSSGFVGVGLICPVLTRIGRSDLAWRLVLTDSYPSWLFSVKNGATTIWERWDGWTPEHGFQDPAMNSFNHYSLGSVGHWLYAGAAGIEADESSPGFRRFHLRPQFTARLSFLKASIDSPYGVISSSWKIDGDRLRYDVTIPPNSSATVHLPAAPQDVRLDGRALPGPEQTTAAITLSAGTYRFSLPRPPIRTAD